MSRLLQSSVFWGVLFAVGCVFGYVFHEQLLPSMAPSMEMGASINKYLGFSGLITLLTVTAILAKNSLVALLCVFMGKLSRGVFPLIVCLVNGTVIGVFGAILAKQGIEVWRFALALTPHGIVELPAIFIACALGMKQMELKERWKAFRTPFVLLAVAAAIETWISPIIVSKVII